MPTPKTILYSSMALAAFVALSSADDAASADTPKGAPIVKVYADWMYNFQDNAAPASQFDLTRAYFGYKEDYANGLSGDVKLDVGRGIGGDTHYTAFLKTAGLKWKDILPMTTVQMGLVGTNAFDAIEGFWGNRFVAKTFMDQNGFANSADLGAKLAVNVADGLTLNGELLNGEGYTKPQASDGNYMGTLSAEYKMSGFEAIAYWDTYNKNTAQSQMTYSGFLAYEMKDVFKIGGEYDYQTANGGTKDHDWGGFSGNAAYYIQKGLYVFGRFDYLSSKSINGIDWDKAGKDGSRIIGGLDYDPAKGVKIAADFQGFAPAADGAKYQPIAELNLQYAL